ncbi:MAG TPA: nucleotide sugar dehydrogenase [Candidatus Paceibacterota bacterium]|nr:nucleotide sugar dehydrogenase [Candidatus Paceibacterota bacterium]
MSHEHLQTHPLGVVHTDAIPNQRQPRDTHEVAVIGLGYVGLPLALLVAEKGHTVTGFDIDAAKISAITKGEASHVGARDRAHLTSLRTFSATTDPDTIGAADTYIICVPTPVSDGHEPDLEPLKSACRTVAQLLKRHALVVIESTINPGVCEEVVVPILERSGLAVERDFYLAHCPERINPGDSRWGVRSIPRVLGAAGPESLARAHALYSGLIDAEITPMRSLKEAEAVKMVENAFRDVNIAFVNELAMSFDRAGINLLNVIRGASTKPFGFLPHYPGAGVGGHCIPVDPYYLIRYGEKNGFEHRFLKTARTINNKMPSYTVSLLAQALRKKRKQLSRSTVALLGLAYKRDVPDERESPALRIRELLEKRGTVVRTFDPYVPDHSSASSLDVALQDADAAVIATDHTLFRTLTPFHFMRAGVNVVVDGRNCLRKEDFQESGILYSGIGRADA